MQAQEIDLSGEICVDGSEEIDTPFGTFTYCVMQGRLGTNQALEMDDTDGGPPMEGISETVADANVFSSTDDVNDPNLPDIPGAEYIDWNDLDLGDLVGTGAVPLGSVENNRILDFTANDDYTIFRPQAASCLNDGSALPKEDFTQSYIANNDEFLYFAQERRRNNGNSVYYWLLTKEPPVLVPDDACSNARGQLQFSLSDGDVELLVNFPDSSDPAGGGVFFRQYMLPGSGYITARDAVFDAGWGPVLSPQDPDPPIINFALNIGGGADDLFPKWGGISRQGDPIPQDDNYYETATFAEWAVDLGEIFPTGIICGERLYITGLSRSSTGQVGELTEPSALKDVVGPKLYSFGEITAAAELTPTCELSFGYSATGVGLDGETPLTNISCDWTCTATSNGDARPITMFPDDASGCTGTGVVGPETDLRPADVSCTVMVTDNDSGCEDDAEATTTVYAPLIVTIEPYPTMLTCTVPGSPGYDNGNISDGVLYSATAAGGDGVYSYVWNVNGPSTGVCGDSPACSVDIPDNNFCARTNISVTVDDGNEECLAVTSEEETVYKETTINTMELP
jgi:hypothetical protein